MTRAEPPAAERIERQVRFVLEVDRLKSVLRQTVLADRSRPENTAEHSWHIALMVVLLAEHSNSEIDVLRVIEMLLVHDIVEIDAGDTFCYDEQANADKEERESAAADRLFGLLPEDQRDRLRALWEEFEARTTPEAKFANAVDRMQPMLLNLVTDGHSWSQHGIVKSQVVERNHVIEHGSQRLWGYVSAWLDRAVEEGLLLDPADSTSSGDAQEST